MTALSRTDFENWRSDAVTRMFYAAANERIEDAKNILAMQAGLNPNEDNHLRGIIRAYYEMQDFRIEDLEDSV